MTEKINKDDMIRLLKFNGFYVDKNNTTVEEITLLNDRRKLRIVVEKERFIYFDTIRKDRIISRQFALHMTEVRENKKSTTLIFRNADTTKTLRFKKEE